MTATTASALIEAGSPSKATLRRRELAAAAQETLADLGYARTSLREIAANTSFSHGLFHYYFEDKQQLVVYSVALYKERCATRYDEVIASSTDATSLLAGFGEELAASLRNDAAQHRLWYDLRNQSLFEEGFRDGVAAIDALLEDMVWRVLCRYAELSDCEVAVERRVAYALFDGLFLDALNAFTYGDLDAVERLRTAGVALLPGLVRGTATA